MNDSVIPSKTDTARKRFVGAGRAQKAKTNNENNAADFLPLSNIEDLNIGSLVVASLPNSRPSKRIVVANQVPDDILFDESLNAAVKMFPEGLLMFSLTICDIIERFTGVETVVMGDVTYGACCIDDYTAKALECDFMIHYGHSCLVPVTVTTIRTLYVFVEIGIDTKHFVDTICKNFTPSTPLVLVATIQFISALQSAKRELDKLSYLTTIPQSKPLSPGEILGCTSPNLNLKDTNSVIVFIGDGRFHLESIMISNPTLSAYRYDPYPKTFTRESYDHDAMRRLRSTAIHSVEERVGGSDQSLVALVVGTLGRQGSPKILSNLHAMVPRGIDSVFVLLSEILADKLKLIGRDGRKVDAWIQTSCPRLSIDWGHSFGTPLLSPYEAAVAFGKADAKWRSQKEEVYPMDFYAKGSRGNWTPNYVEGALEKEAAKTGVQK
ncbi:Diphthamide biosynthesis protein 1 [Physocladia obscura]|uniref:2-(3-amino-3-carboxypropyl)histidine synthase subunit 1 n=1 Tax=Physocladia obscura TaxID=109957 RepID=A0AAD5SSY2_9FUNG|nr:Diphthamide biosynthesis protein 1 [Physocladia obscura]